MGREQDVLENINIGQSKELRCSVSIGLIARILWDFEAIIF